jgi:outer membrane protein OmpA-like peptidoglycan-associated protein
MLDGRFEGDEASPMHEHAIEPEVAQSVPPDVQPVAAPPSWSPDVRSITALQKTAGNAAVGRMLAQRQAPATGASQRMLQRKTEQVMKPSWGNVIIPPDNSSMTFEPTAKVFLGDSGTPGPAADFPGVPGSRQQELKLPEGTTSGRVVINVRTNWFRNVWSGNQEGTGSVVAEARFKVSPDNKIEWQGPAQANVTSDGSGASTTATASATGDTLSVTPTINGVGSVGDTSSSTVQVAPGGVGGSKASGRTITLPQGSSETKTFSVVLTPAPIAEQSHSFAAYFQIDSDKVEAKSETDVVVWFKSGLPQHVRDSIQDGVTELLITGHASTTNTGEYNRKLSNRRAKKIEEILRDVAGTKAKMVLKAPGYYEAKQFDDKSGQKTVEEDSSERFVEVTARYLQKPGSKP